MDINLGFTPTVEQNVCADIFKDPLVKWLTIQARSGSGKTSTLRYLAHLTTEKVIYLAFNKAMALEAAKKMPNNVECRTLHSLCYSFLDKNLRSKLTRPEGKYVNVAGTGSEISKKYKISNLVTKEGLVMVTRGMLGLMVKETVGKYEFSDDKHLNRDHFPHHLLKDIKKKYPSLNETVVINDVVKYAKQLWRDRIDPKSDVLMTHDTYVKLFELSGRDIGYSVVFGDEFQDVNPAFVSILRNAESAKKIVVVGDEYQSIYQFRGSENMMGVTSRYGKETYLTACFRFGDKVATLANKMLSWDKPMVGELSGLGFNTVAGGMKSNLIDTSKPYTIIYRKNMTLLMDAMDKIAAGESVSLNVDVKDFVSMVDSVNALRRGEIEKIRHESILPYATWQEFVDDAEVDPDVKRLLNIIVSGKAQEIAFTLRQHKNPKNAKVTLTTAHKCKGLEWEQVIIANDFPSMYDKEKNLVGLNDAERNLLYVAHTRAIKVLKWNSTMQEVVDLFKVSGEQKISKDKS